MVKGVVSKIIEKQFNGVTLTSFFLKGQDGLFSLGEDKPTFAEGESIQFETTERGRYTYAKDIAPWVGSGATTAPAVKFSKPFFGGKNKSDEEKQYWANKDAQHEITQRRIEIQAARNAAIETAQFLWEKDLVAKPKKIADQYDAFLALVDQIAQDYIKNTEAHLSGGNGEDSGGDVPEASAGDEVESGNDAANWD